nr:thiazole synthase [Campylobacter sp.]
MDKFKLGGKEFNSRFIIGSGKFDPNLIQACINEGEVEIVTMALRRVHDKNENITNFIPKNITLLPNTSGARNADEALRIARLARELGCGEFIKIEVIRESKYLFPDNYESTKATELLAKDGFIPLVYMYPDLNTARDLLNAGAAAIMPLAAPIGSNKGMINRDIIQILIDEIKAPIIVDAGLGRPSEACLAMEMGCAAVMANTAIATANDVKGMAKAFAGAIKAGRIAYLSGLGRVRDTAQASSPLTGFLE